MVNEQEIAAKISERGLRVTPQRIIILSTILQLGNHPAAENIIDHLKKQHPYISAGTVYKTLDVFVETGLLQKVKTESGTMRYDPLQYTHHHLFCEKTDRIADYEDAELDELISDYFRKKGIDNFDIQHIQLHITGNFKN